MYNKCCVENCASVRQNVKMHQFPTSEVGHQKWLECIGSDHLLSISKTELRVMFVCHKHFEKRFITSSARLRLNSYPTLFTENEIASGLPAVPSENKMDTQRDQRSTRKRHHDDHTYSKETEMPQTRASSSHALIAIEDVPEIDSDAELIMPTSPIETIHESLTESQNPKTIDFGFSTPIQDKKNRRRLVYREKSLTPRCNGINNQIFDTMKQEVETWSETKRYCSIIFDEVSLQPGLNYDKTWDAINEFVKRKAKSNEFADHALAFMVRGAVHKWQQPVALYFCEGATSKEQVKLILKEVVAAVVDTKLFPVSLISDQGSTFESPLKSLLEDTRREQLKAGKPTDEVVSLNGHDMVVIFDPPHLIKEISNNFLTKNIISEGKMSKWSDIVDVYQTDCNHAQPRLLYKLSDRHVLPSNRDKMKVQNCTRALSKTMAAALFYTSQLSHYSDGRPVSLTLANTAETVSFFDDLFDSCNGAALNSKKTKGKNLRKPVTNRSEHHSFWQEAINKLDDMKFVEQESGAVHTVHSLKNWVITLKSFERLWQFFQSKNIKIMRTNYFNSDPIENFFGQVRAYSFNND